MSSDARLNSLAYLYYGMPDVMDALWQDTVLFTKKLIIPNAKGDVLKKATYPHLFSNGYGLLLPMLNEYGDVIKVVALKNRGTSINNVENTSVKSNSIMYWPGDKNNDTLYIVTTLSAAIKIKYNITDNEGIVPDVLFINSFKHVLKDKDIYKKYKYIIAIGPPQIQTILSLYKLVPTITLYTNKLDYIDPIYIIIRFLREIINEKNLSKSSNCRVSIESLKEQHPSVFTNINVSPCHRTKRTTLRCMRHTQTHYDRPI